MNESSEGQQLALTDCIVQLWRGGGELLEMALKGVAGRI
jgi:hypothetical protein